MVKRKNPEDSVPFTSVPITIHKRIAVCGDEDEEKMWKSFFNDKKADKHFKKWIVEAYQQMEIQEKGLKIDCDRRLLDTQTYEDIFENDDDWVEILKMGINKMFRKINKVYFPEIALKENKQYFLKLKLEEEVSKKENEDKNE
ncbi:MAG: hypothetical protein ACOCV1_08355 [Bacillota bacterium]